MQRVITDLEAAARDFAVERHGGQLYGDGNPYAAHLQATVDILVRYEITDPEILAGAWTHDVVEDTPATVEEVRLLLGDKVAHIVDLVSEPDDGSRHDKHMYAYPRIREYPDAVLVKLADRLANTRGLRYDDPSTLRYRALYREEYLVFNTMLHRGHNCTPVENHLWREIREHMYVGPKEHVRRYIKDFLVLLAEHVGAALRNPQAHVRLAKAVDSMGVPHNADFRDMVEHITKETGMLKEYVERTHVACKCHFCNDKNSREYLRYRLGPNFTEMFNRAVAAFLA